jgi:hypothetical protein
LQLKQNLAPIRNTLSKAMSGGVKAVSSGRSRLNAFWGDLERAANEEETNASPPVLENTQQQAGRLLSNFSSFLSRKTKEFSQAMEVNIYEK